MTALLRADESATTSTAISDALASPIAPPPLASEELLELGVPDWVDSVARQLHDLATLPDDWDGYGARALRRDVISFAYHLLASVMRPETPAPHVTPMSHEGVMLEWHENGFDLEIEIKAPGKIWVAFEDRVEGIDNEWPVSTDLTSLQSPIDKITNQDLAHA